MEQIINIKPLSVNEAYKGRKYQTDKLKGFKSEVSYFLRPIKIPEGKLDITLEFGFSSKGSDLDNAVKPFLDVLQKKYVFNDNRVYKLNLSKRITAKNKEYIKFEIKELKL